MQSTVFDFTFNLKNVDNYVYLVPTSYMILDIDFKTVLIKKSTVDFAMASHFRERDAGDLTYLSIDDFCVDNEDVCRMQRSYLDGKYAYQDLFSLDIASGFNYSPEVLLRDTLYHDVIIARGYTDDGFFSNQITYLTRGHKFLNSITVEVGLLDYGFEIPPIDSSNVFNFTAGVFISEAPHTTESSFGMLVSVLDSAVFGIIENKIYHKPIFYSEKTSLLLSPTVDIEVTADILDLSLSSVLAEAGFELTVNAIDNTSLSPLLSKYAIIMLNNEADLGNYYSPSSRYIYLEG